MTILTIPAGLAIAQAWHDGGMFMGMHWLWWTVWILTLLVLVWGFLRLFADRSDTDRRIRREEAAEEELRRRFARGEIDEDEYAARLEVLRDSSFGR